jgi:hypothetical protein
MLITHLLYADDMVLLAHNYSGLKALVDGLQQLATAKGLTVNVKKSQYMVFNPSPHTRRASPPGIRFGSDTIDYVTEFKYLGMVFDSKCDLVKACDSLSSSMGCAIRDIMRTGSDQGILRMPHAMLKLFQTFVISRAMYASQVWGTAFLSTARMYKNSLQLKHLGFLKSLIGLKRSVSNDCLMSELCQKPLQYYWLRSAVRFWNGLEESNSKLLLAAAKADAHLARTCNSCWCGQLIEALGAMNAFPGQDLHSQFHSVFKFAVPDITTAWRKQFACRWSDVNENPRDPDVPARQHCTYKTFFKRDVDDSVRNLHPYLKDGLNLSPNTVRSMCRFRLSSHKLRVETGRYNNTPYAHRVCTRCDEDLVEDEQHVLFECHSFADLRDTTFTNLYNDIAFGDVRALMCTANYRDLARYIHLCMCSTDRWYESGYDGLLAHETHDAYAEQPQG